MFQARHRVVLFQSEMYRTRAELELLANVCLGGSQRFERDRSTDRLDSDDDEEMEADSDEDEKWPQQEVVLRKEARDYSARFTQIIFCRSFTKPF